MDSYAVLIPKFIIAFFLTIIIESISLYLSLNLLFKKKYNYKELLAFGIIPSTTTLPYLWFVLPYFIKPKQHYIIIGELLVTLIEFVLLKTLTKLSAKNCIILSIIANTSSYFIGDLIVRNIRFFQP